MENALFKTHVRGMTCRQCEDVICEKLQPSRGIITVKADCWKAAVSVEYDPDITSTQDICTQLSEAGYPAEQGNTKHILSNIITALIIALLCLCCEKLKLPSMAVLKQGAGLILLFLTGLAASPHCLIMCGGIMLSQTADTVLSGQVKKHYMTRTLAYNLGRVITCTLLGAVFGAAGQMIMYTAKMKSIVFTLSGIGVTVSGLQLWGIIPPFRLFPVIPSHTGVCQHILPGNNWQPFAVGMLNGLMPCTILSAMWLYTLSSGSAINGASDMAAWSLGTVPLMLLLGTAGSLVPQKYAKCFIRLAYIITISLGIKMLIAGVRILP